MAGIMNKTERQIDLRVCGAKGGIVTVSLNPGFNLVDDEFWALAKKNSMVKKYEAGGAIVSGAKKTREDELAEQKVREEMELAEQELQRTARAASVVEGDTHVAESKPAVALGAGVGGADVVEGEGVTASDDSLLG